MSSSKIKRADDRNRRFYSKRIMGETKQPRGESRGGYGVESISGEKEGAGRAGHTQGGTLVLSQEGKF